LGLSNSVLLIAIYMLGIPASFILMAAKVVLSGFMFAGVNAMMYALAGGVLSVATMSILSRFKSLSPVGVGISGGVTHNIGQVGLAMIVLNSDSLIFYMAVLMLIGVFTGAATGTVCKIMMKRLPNDFLV
ncbi:MAG: Gx transporter family protein, partial [Clostridia bacterium]|nr:Gx transporter family protein [Clostridia bacterium]